MRESSREMSQKDLCAELGISPWYFAMMKRAGFMHQFRGRSTPAHVRGWITDYQREHGREFVASDWGDKPRFPLKARGAATRTASAKEKIPSK